MVATTALARTKAPAQRCSMAGVEKLKDAIVAWKLTTPERRDPSTIRGLAKKLGKPKSTISYYA